MLNLVFSGEFTYPEGLAGTKRIQHFIDYLKKENTVSVLLLNKKKTIKNSDRTEPHNQDIKIAILGQEFKLSFHLLYQIPITIFCSCKTLWKWKIKNCRNFYYIYGGINAENLITVIFARIMGYSIVVEYTEDLRFYPGRLPVGIRVKNRTNVLFERLLPCLASGIVVISHHLFSKFKKYQHSIPVIHIPISATVNILKKPKTKFGVPLIIAYSGTFGAKDGLESLISAFIDFSKDNPESYLYLTGKTKNTNNIEQYLIHDKIKYLGYIPDDEFYSFIESADILCITRNNMQYANAGFPFKLGEYLATGRPVITSNVCNVTFYIENHRDAMIVEPGNPGQICEALRFLVNNPHKAQEIGINGQRRCQEHFNPQTNGKMLLDYLNTLK